MKDFYDLGEQPEFGSIPDSMLAYTVRQSRFGEPEKSLLVEKIPVPKELKENEVLVYVMAAGINYNVAWAGKGKPLDVIKFCHSVGDTREYFVPGSEASGIVYKVGSKVTNVSVGDEVIVTGNVYHSKYNDKNELVLSPFSTVWGYEVNDGALAQYCRVQDTQCIIKPKNLPWSEAACYMASGATAYNMLFGWKPNDLKPGEPVLIFGGAGGLGCIAIQLAKYIGARPVAVVSSSEKEKFCMELGAVGTINRNNFNHWGKLPDPNDAVSYKAWYKEAKRFREAFYQALGSKDDPTIVFEHPGRDTLPTAMYITSRMGMVVTCAATTGYDGTLDIRHLWMFKKRLQGSHYSTNEQCQIFTDLIADGHIKTCLSKVFNFEEGAIAHQLMMENKHPSGNMAILVNSKA